MVIGGISTVKCGKLPPKVLFSFGAFSFFYQETRKDTIKTKPGSTRAVYGDAGEPPVAYGDGIVNRVTPNVAKVELCRNDKNKNIFLNFFQKTIDKKFFMCYTIKVQRSKALRFHLRNIDLCRVNNRYFL